MRNNTNLLTKRKASRKFRKAVKFCKDTLPDSDFGTGISRIVFYTCKFLEGDKKAYALASNLFYEYWQITMQSDHPLYDVI